MRATVANLARLLLAIVLLGAAIYSDVARPALAVEQPPAASYPLDAKGDVDAGRVDVDEVLSYRNVVGVPLQSLVFRVVPNIVGTFGLARTTVDGLDVSASLDGSVLEIPLSVALAPAATTEIGLKFSIFPP